MFRVALFWEDAFPTIDASPRTLLGLQRALEGFDLTVLGNEDLERLPEFDLLVLPFGSAFPRAHWPEIVVFLEAGGNLLNLVGAPFAVPCTQRHIVWKPQTRQTAFHKELRINQAYPVDADRVASLDVPEDNPILAGLAEPIRGRRLFELTVRFTDSRDHPYEGGSSGPRDAVLRPLLYGLDAGGRRVAAPVIAIDRLRGAYAGGRWVFANVDGSLPPEAIRRLAFYAALGASDFTVNPSFACYHDNEQPHLTVHAGRFGTLRGRHSGHVTVTTPDGRRSGYDLPAVMSRDLPSYRWTHTGAPLFGPEPLAPGLYTVEATLVDEEARDLAGQLGIPEATRPGARVHRNGFWVWDDALMAAGSPLELDRDYFRRDGLPYPVMGTTYMGSDVHRKFLFEPNPHIWDRDMEEMCAAGVNMLRTGVWTGWRRIMLDPGVPDEGCLRALDAFFLSARKHDLPIIFTFFAFLPEMWEGENPYLYPRSVAAQKDFVAAIIVRYTEVPGLLWDLINAPSFCSPKRVWSTRPNGDAHEQRAWAEWLSREPASEVQDRWRVTPRQGLGLPADADFQDRFIFQGTHPMKALDYRLFAQEMFNGWAGVLRQFIRMRAARNQWITVGQDEGGTHERPNPQFHARYVDFTSNHSWWRNDDLLWDSIVTKTPAKPNLIEETGIMFIEDVDGSYRRTEEECRNLLERKLALAIGGAGAGAIQWLWNTNVVMDSDNEVSIGFLRADHTAKPELAPFTAMAEFLWRNRARMQAREPEPVVMLIPYSNMFSVRDLATPATRACVRTFHYDNAMPLRAVGEYNVDDLGEPRLILLPSPRVLRQEAWDALLGRAAAGATLLVTGPVNDDPYWRPCDRLSAFGLNAHTRPVAREETCLLAGRPLRLTFSGEKVHRIDKAVVAGATAEVAGATAEVAGATAEVAGATAEVVVLPHGKGKVIFAPLPFELADNLEPLAALYDFALAESGTARPFALEAPQPGILVRPLLFDESVLYVLSSESDEDRQMVLLHGPGRVPVPVAVPAQRSVLLFVERATGAVLDQYVPVCAMFWDRTRK